MPDRAADSVETVLAPRQLLLERRTIFDREDMAALVLPEPPAVLYEW